ncbi:MAG: hypothetical protein JXA03_05410 [Bacteroidales bacterium]|nr:hypothetical protein [Bacteroidales bacterium]
MSMQVRKRKKRKKKFKEITFKLTAKQGKSLSNYCKARKTTPVKLIKKSIKRYLEKYDVEVPDQYFISAKQLELFNEEPAQFDRHP